MNYAYRAGYHDGLALAREDAELDLPFRSPGGVRLEASNRYGNDNKAKVNSLKCGFRDGYATGKTEAETLRVS